MGYVLALLFGYLVVRSASGDSSGGGGSYAGGSGPVSFEPKVAAEILRNLIMYTSEVVTTPAEKSAKLERLKLHYEDKVLESKSAFNYAAAMNKAGYAILGPKGMWDYQPWSDKQGQLLFILASDPEAIAAMASKDSPWAVIIRVPGKLAKFVDMTGAKVASDLRAADIV